MELLNQVNLVNSDMSKPVKQVELKNFNKLFPGIGVGGGDYTYFNGQIPPFGFCQASFE